MVCGEIASDRAAGTAGFDRFLPWVNGPLMQRTFCQKNILTFLNLGHSENLFWKNIPIRVLVFCILGLLRTVGGKKVLASNLSLRKENLTLIEGSRQR